MARPRLPTNVLKLKGADKKDPKRIRERDGEPQNTSEVGAPPAHLNKVQKEAFKEIVKYSINGVLGEADRLAVEQAAILLVKCRSQHEENGEIIPATAAEQGHFFKYLSQFGMTPADRSKISIPKEKKKNPFDE